ncbi:MULTISPECIES: hypothetical protein [Acidianus]|nr:MULTISPECIES: hypothetical protein [Acidianus]NON61706.1 hypothetical protein [Acidianus sp. RZ1]
MDLQQFLRYIELRMDAIASTYFGLVLNRAKVNYINDNWSSLVRSLEKSKEISIEVEIDLNFFTPDGEVKGKYTTEIAIKENLPPEEGLSDYVARLEKLIELHKKFLRRTQYSKFI